MTQPAAPSEPAPPLPSAPPGLPRVVIVGCGFGGIEATRTLASLPVEVTVVDRTNHHLFQPLLYQVATAGLAATAVSAPIRHVLRQQMMGGRLTVLQARVDDIDVAGRCVRIDGGRALPYDHLIVAAGAGHSYFGHDEWAEFAPGLKTLADALKIRAHVIGAYEAAEREPDPVARAPWMTSVVIGGGATGVEMAGTMIEIARQTLPKEFRHIDSTQARVILLEGSDRILGSFAPELSKKGELQLAKLGVDVRTGCQVVGIDAEGVDYETHDATGGRTRHRLAARTVIWGAGVAASPLGRVLHERAGAELDRAGRVVVEPDLSLRGHPEIWVVGDLAAAMTYPKKGEPKKVPGVSPAAKQAGRAAAANIGRRLRGEPGEPFRYVDYGSLATVGRQAAVVELDAPLLGPIRFSGFPAWLFWLCAHIWFLIGFRNRLAVMIEWGWSYLTHQRSARVIVEPPAEPSPANQR